MKREHHRIFLEAAQRYNCWIGLREPNPLADKWIGRAGYIPKSDKVKAKTADQSDHPLAGLVVDPTLCPKAFSAASRERAKANWNPAGLPSGAQVVQDGPQKGLVLLDGKGIYADFDLMCLVKADERGEMAYTTGSEAMALHARVALFINTRMRVKMIQHGPEFDPDFHDVGAKENELVLYYGPGGKSRAGYSSMSKKSPH